MVGRRAYVRGAGDAVTRPQRAVEFAAIARRIEQERRDASIVVERILRVTPREEWQKLETRAEFQTLGAVERVGILSTNHLAKDPADARSLAELAVHLAERMPESAYPLVMRAQAQAQAWKDLGKALRFLGRNAEAISAFEFAKEQAERHPALAHDRAIIRFNLAYSLQELERFDESIAALAEAKQGFRDHGDTENVVLVGFAEGVLLQRLRRFREAREVYLLLLASTRDLNADTLAAIHHAIGFCSVDLGDFDDAEANLLNAMALHRQNGKPIHILNAELGRGRLLIRKGDLEDGINHLRPIRREFLRNGMHEEAGLCGLEIVEALLLLQRASEAETLARKIVGEFTVAHLSNRAITALGYLAEAIAARSARPALVSDVREYIVSLRTKPERDFRLAM